MLHILLYLICEEIAMKIQINTICKKHDQILAPQIKRGVHTKKVYISK